MTVVVVMVVMVVMAVMAMMMMMMMMNTPMTIFCAVRVVDAMVLRL